jgi:hypothetical protein
MKDEMTRENALAELHTSNSGVGCPRQQLTHEMLITTCITTKGI